MVQSTEYDTEFLDYLRDDAAFFNELKGSLFGDAEAPTPAECMTLAVTPEAGGSDARALAAWALVDLEYTWRDGTDVMASAVVSQGVTLDLAKRLYLERLLSHLLLGQLADLVLDRGRGNAKPHPDHPDQSPETREELGVFVAQALERDHLQVETGLDVMNLNTRDWIVFRQQQGWLEDSNMPLTGVMVRRMLSFWRRPQQAATVRPPVERLAW